MEGMIRISLLHGSDELKDLGYREQAVRLTITKKYRWTWKLFGPFKEAAIIDGLGVTIEGFSRPIILGQPRPYYVEAGGRFTIAAGWKLELT